jgi:hypothetical protein
MTRFSENNGTFSSLSACLFADNLLYYCHHTHRASMRQRIAYFGEFFCL